MAEEGYNGWTNRETWAANLWLSNDEGLYSLTLERVADAVTDLHADGDLPRWIDETDPSHVLRHRETVAADTVSNLWAELTDPTEGLMSVEAILEMVNDVGSEWRIDWQEIGPHWLPENQ